MSKNILIEDIRRIHNLMGVKTSKYISLLSENVTKSLIGKTANEFGETGANLALRTEFKTAIQNWQETNLPLKSGGKASFEQTVQAAQNLAKSKGLTDLSEGEALALLARETGGSGFKDFTSRLMKIQTQSSSENFKKLSQGEVEDAIKNSINKLENFTKTVQNEFELGTIDIPTTKLKLESLETVINNGKRISQEYKDSIIPEIQKLKLMLDNYDVESLNVPTTPLVKELDLLLPKTVITNKYETPISAILKDKTISTKVEKTIRDVLYSDPNKVKVSNLDETFGDNPKIYDKSMAGQTGYDEFGLTKEFSDFLKKEKPLFLKQLSEGKYKNLVDEDGSWDPLNKLDTNINDKKTLFEDYAKLKGFTDTKNMTEDEVKTLMQNFIDDATQDPQKMKNLIETSRSNYTTNITKNSAEGDRIAKNFEERFQSGPLNKKFELVWVPKSEGNALDKTGVDMVIKDRTTGEFHFVQIKKSGDLKLMPSAMPDKEGVNSIFGRTFSSVNIQKGFVGLEDKSGNWILFPPQDAYKLGEILIDPNTKKQIKTFVPNIDPETGLTKKQFNKQYFYVDVNPKIKGDEFYTNIQIDPITKK